MRPPAIVEPWVVSNRLYMLPYIRPFVACLTKEFVASCFALAWPLVGASLSGLPLALAPCFFCWGACWWPGVSGFAALRLLCFCFCFPTCHAILTLVCGSRGATTSAEVLGPRARSPLETAGWPHGGPADIDILLWLFGFPSRGYFVYF